jgi:hypothetical protein
MSVLAFSGLGVKAYPRMRQRYAREESMMKFLSDYKR